MPKARPHIPARNQKIIFQEAMSRCAFCPEVDVSALEIHHIDLESSNNVESNLILVCSSCHSKITAGVISEADVVTKKRELYWSRPTAKIQTTAVNVSITGSNFRGDIAQNITKIVAPRVPKIQHPVGSIGADLMKKGYVDYLISKYYKFRSADKSYGRKTKFSHAVIHTNIQTRFGHKTFFIPVEYFDQLVKFLQEAIDNTIQGKRNRAEGKNRYHSFEQHQILPEKA